MNRLLQDKPTILAGVSLVLIAIHLVNASLFHLESPLLERCVWAILSVATLGAAAGVYGAMDNGWRGLVMLAVGLPAFIVGLTIHVGHVYQMGVEASSYTGLPMLAAGAVLTVSGVGRLVRLIHTWWRRLLLIPAGIVVLLFGVFPVSLAVYATNVAVLPCCDETPADYGFAYEDVAFQTGDGATISAWFIRPHNGATVIAVHGAGGNRSVTMDESIMLARHGYGVLMLDVEGYGNSDGRANAFGWGSERSIHAAIAYLATRPEVDMSRLGGLGLSMGGEVLLQAASESTALRAVVAEGATGRTAQDFGEQSDGLPIYAVHTVVGAAMHLIAGEKQPAPLKQLVQRIGPRRVLLIGSQVKEERELMTMYRELGGPSFDLWLIPEPKHVGGYKLHPEEYEQRVVGFFDEALRPTPVEVLAR